MTQVPLEFGLDARATESWGRLLRILRSAVDDIGPKEVIARLDVQPSVLSEALKGDGTRHVQARWLPAILLLASDDHRKAILDELAGLAGYELKPRRKLTDAERLERLEGELRRRLGRVGEQLIEEVGR